MSPNTLRAPAVPLIVHDPYFSLWSFHDELNGGECCHWTGSRVSVAGLIRIDGKPFRFCGVTPGTEKMKQISVEILPARTVYRFEAAGVRLSLTFLTPALPHRIDVLARPLSYLCYDCAATDGRPHTAELYCDFGGELCVDRGTDPVVRGSFLHPEFDLTGIASARQEPLGRCGDDLRIDWGRFYMALPHDGGFRRALAPRREMRRQFLADGTLPAADDLDVLAPASAAGMANAVTLSVPAEGAASAWFAVAYDDIRSVEYLHTRLPGYWRKAFDSFAALLTAAKREYAELRAECEREDAEWMSDMTRIGGETFAKIGALAFRQAIGAHKTVLAPDGKTPFFFSKENFSNGCIATVDVTYPSAPLFLLAAPELLKGMLIPILDYARSDRWKFPFAPHDLGTYPLADGQVYGGGEKTEDDQMPVEECGNLLILAGALLKFHNDVAFVGRYRETFRRWAEYLLDKGYDPDNQLCTDDFAGHLAHNTNLSLKAILALGAYAEIASALGGEEEAEKFRAAARNAAERWSRDALDGDHYRLAFDLPGSWSQKYNLVWDRLLGLGLFSEEIARRETAFYRRKLEKYGLPLDSRRSYTKLDWIFWCASLTGRREDFDALIEPVRRWLNETPSRVPMCDWYETTDGRKVGFQARSVVGGLFLPMLADAGLRAKYAAKRRDA